MQKIHQLCLGSAAILEEGKEKLKSNALTNRSVCMHPCNDHGAWVTEKTDKREGVVGTKIKLN